MTNPPTSVLASGEPATAALLRVDRRGRTLQTVDTLHLGSPFLVPASSSGRTILAYQPLNDRDLVAAHPDGRGFAVVERRPATTRDSSDFTVTYFGSDGDLRWRQSVGYRPAPVPAGVADSLVGVAADRLPSHLGLEDDEIRDALYLPDHFPPVTDAVVGGDGSVWLRRSPPTARDGQVVWQVLGPDGRPEKRVQLPASAKLLAVDGNTAWVREQSPLDVHRVVRYLLPSQR